MNTALNRNGSSSTPRRRAARTTTGVRNTTAVSRFNTAVTTVTSIMLAASRATAGPGTCSSSRPACSNNPSECAARPTSSNPVTSTNAGQACCTASLNRITPASHARHQQRRQPQSLCGLTTGCEPASPCPGPCWGSTRKAVAKAVSAQHSAASTRHTRQERPTMERRGRRPRAGGAQLAASAGARPPATLPSPSVGAPRSGALIT
jgi:hypothetical protein